MKNKLPLYYTAAFLFLLVTWVLINKGWTEESNRFFIRSTAKTSLLLFLLAFSASSIYKLWPGTWSRNILQARRYLGLSFALSHSVHLAFVLSLQFYFSAQNFEERGFLVVSGGAVAYVFLYAMAFTSTDAQQKKMGMKKWSRLHTMGSYYIFIVFCVSYIPRAFQEPFYLPFALLLTIALLLKGVVKFRKKTLL